jgi:hypothetical protein
VAFASGDVHSATFLAGNIVYQTTQALLNAKDEGEDVDVLNDATVLMDIVTSYFTETDQTFLKEYEAIQKDRKKATILDDKNQLLRYEPGIDRGMDAAFRHRELRAMFRSMCRVGKMTRIDSPSAEWNPEVST